MCPNLSAQLWSKTATGLPSRREPEGVIASLDCKQTPRGFEEGPLENSILSLRRALNHRLDSTVKNVDPFVARFNKKHEFCKTHEMDVRAYQRSESPQAEKYLRAIRR